MKCISITIVPMFSVLVISSTRSSQDDIRIPDGPCLGQTPPSSTPAVLRPVLLIRRNLLKLRACSHRT